MEDCVEKVGSTPEHDAPEIHQGTENNAMDGINSDKVNIHVGGGEGGSGGGMQAAAMVAALGNRNQGDNTAALIAALGNRNDGHRGDDGLGFGGGGGVLGLVALLGLLGRGRGFGGGDDCGDGGGDHARTAILQTLIEGQADLRAQVPTVALEIQNACQRAISELALGTQQGFSNVKDSVQAIGALNLSATQGVAKDVATGTLQTIIGIGNDGDKTRALITNFNNENLQRQLTVAQLEGVEGRLRSHSDNVEVKVSQQVNQAQAQAQSQRLEESRFDRLERSFLNLGQQIAARTAQDIVNLGTMIGSAGQTSTAVNQK